MSVNYIYIYIYIYYIYIYRERERERERETRVCVRLCRCIRIYLASYQTKMWHKIGFKGRVPCRKHVSHRVRAQISSICRHFPSGTPQALGNKPSPYSFLGVWTGTVLFGGAWGKSLETKLINFLTLLVRMPGVHVNVFFRNVWEPEKMRNKIMRRKFASVSHCS